MHQKNAVNSSFIRAWLLNNTSTEAIIKELSSKGIDEVTIQSYLEELKKQRYSKRQFKGFVMIGFGAFLGFVSCVLTLSELFPQWYGPILYGLTFIGVSIVCWGMYFVFEN